MEKTVLVLSWSSGPTPPRLNARQAGLALLVLPALVLIACGEPTPGDDAPSADTEFDADTEDRAGDEETGLPGADPGPPDSVFPDFDPSDVSDEVLAVVDRYTRIVPSDDGKPIPTSATDELEELRIRFAHSLAFAVPAPQLLARRAADVDPIELRFIRVGEIAKGDEEVPAASDAPSVIPTELLDGAQWLDGFSSDTRNHIRVRIPRELLNSIGEHGEALGAHRGVPGDEEGVPRSISDGVDTRVLKGSLNTKQTSTNLKRIVMHGFKLGVATTQARCTGTLIGPAHTVTAGHCLYAGNGAWNFPRLYAGRNGNNSPNPWWAYADTGSSTWFWVSSVFVEARDQGSAPLAYDFGVAVHHGSRMGDVVGWFGWHYAGSFPPRYNRGYPDCTSSIAPPNCQPKHMFGDTNSCDTMTVSSPSDSYGYPLIWYHSCDTSGGHSGSAIYEFGYFWNVRAVNKGTDFDDHFKTGASAVTRDRANYMLTLRSMYP